MYKKILIATDGSSISNAALHNGLALAAGLHAATVVLTVIEPFHVLSMSASQLEDVRKEYEQKTLEHAGAILADATRHAGLLGVACETRHQVHDRPYQAILDTAEHENCDLIVMGSHGRHGLASLVLGSQTLKVLTHSTRAVLVFR